MNRVLLLVATAIWSVSGTSSSNDVVVYEDGFVSDFNYNVHESSLNSQEVQQQAEDGFVSDFNYNVHESSLNSQEVQQQAEDGFVSDFNYNVHESSLNSQELQQQADTGLWLIGSENSPSRVARDLQHHSYEHWIPPNPEHTDMKYGHIVKRDVTAVEDDFEVSHLDDHNVEDAIADASDDEHLNDNYYYEGLGSGWHQDEESLEGRYELDSHEEPVEERTHGVRARQPRDEEEEEADGQNDAEVASIQIYEGSQEERISGEENIQPRYKEASNEDSSSKAINKRKIRQSARNYEKRLQSAINNFYAEEAKEWSAIEKKKRDITSALASDYHGHYTMAELEAAVESALNEYYGQKIVNRLKRAAYMEMDYKEALQKEKEN